MKKLTKAQSDIVRRMADGQWYTAYDLGCKISTLNALYEKSLLWKNAGRGSLFCPRTAIRFSLSTDIEKIQDRLI
jgi:hypothetical protein